MLLVGTLSVYLQEDCSTSFDAWDLITTVQHDREGSRGKIRYSTYVALIPGMLYYFR